MGVESQGLSPTDSTAAQQSDKTNEQLNTVNVMADSFNKSFNKSSQPGNDTATKHLPGVNLEDSGSKSKAEHPSANPSEQSKPGDAKPADGKPGNTAANPAEQPKPGEEKHGNTTVKKDNDGKIKEYDNGDYSLSKHDDGKWYYHQNGDGHDFVEVDGNSIKMDDKGKVTYNESGMFGNDNQTLGKGSTGGINDVTSAVTNVTNDVVRTATDVVTDPTNLGKAWNDATHTVSDVATGVTNVAKDAVGTVADVGKNVALGIEGYGEGMVNGAIDTLNHFSKEAHDGWGLPELHINDITLANQAEVDNSWGGKAGKFVGGLGSKLTQAVGDMAVDLGKATYNWDKMMVNDAATLVNDAMNDPSKLGSDFANMGQQAEDFGKGFVEGLAIKPINGVMGGVDSALNWMSDSHDFDNRFKLGNLVDEEYERTHAAAKMGDVVGNVTLQVALAVATDGVAEAVAPMLSAGARVVTTGARALTGGARAAEGAEEAAVGAEGLGRTVAQVGDRGASESPTVTMPRTEEVPTGRAKSPSRTWGARGDDPVERPLTENTYTRWTRQLKTSRTYDEDGGFTETHFGKRPEDRYAVSHKPDGEGGFREDYRFEDPKKNYTREVDREGHAVITDSVGLKIEMKGASPEFQRKMFDEIQKIPEAERKLLADSHINYSVVGKMSDIDPALSGVRPRGWPEGKTWDDVDGAFMGDRNAIVVAERTNEGITPRAEGVLRHETGHGVDWALGQYSHSNAFDIAYDNDVADMMYSHIGKYSYLMQGGFAGREEAFAEIYGALKGASCNLNQTDELLRIFPSLGRSIQWALNRYTA